MNKLYKKCITIAVYLVLIGSVGKAFASPAFMHKFCCIKDQELLTPQAIYQTLVEEWVKADEDKHGGESDLFIYHFLTKLQDPMFEARYKMSQQEILKLLIYSSRKKQLQILKEIIYNTPEEKLGDVLIMGKLSHSLSLGIELQERLKALEKKLNK